MKYFTSGIIVIIIVIALAFWLKKAPADNVLEQPIETPATASDTQEASITQEVVKESLKESKITMKNGMKIEITKEGTGEEITNGRTAVVDYVGKLTDGTIFDASKNHGNTGFSFSLGAGQVIKGWDQGVLGMKVGEVRVLTIPPELGYGATGAGGVIPPNATLTFEVTLLAIK